MPYKSLSQSKWAHTPEGTKALGGKEKVAEWDSFTSYDKLPEHVIPDKVKKKALHEAIRNSKKK